VLGGKSPLQVKAQSAVHPKPPAGKVVNKGVKQAAEKPAGKVQALPPQAQAPLQGYAAPIAHAAAAVARGQMPKALEVMAAPQPKPLVAQLPKTAAARGPSKMLKAGHVQSGIKASPVAARAGPAHLPPVQAVAQPMTAAVAAEKPVKAVAEPVVPVRQVAGAV